MAPVMARRRTLILGIGSPSLELLGAVRSYPERGATAELQQFSIQGEGNAATALVALCAWGYRGRFVGKVSNDPFGALIRETLKVPGLDARPVVTEQERISPFAFVAVPDGQPGGRTAFRTEGTLTPLSPRDAPAALLDGCGALVVDGTEPEAQLPMARRARRAGLTTLLHPARFDERLVELIGLADVLVVSERFAVDVASRGSPEESAKALHALGPRTVVVTMGIDGCAAYDGVAYHRRVIVPDLPVVDRAGVGAVFAAGVLHGTLAGWPLARRLAVATAAAGLACGQLGSRAGIPTLEEAEALAGRSQGPDRK
jgi:ribokinase